MQSLGVRIIPALPLLALLCGCGGATEPALGPDERVVGIVAMGDGQSGDAGASLASALAIRVSDANGDPISGAHVEWVVVSGGGTVTGDALTSAVGTVTGIWTLGAIVDVAQSVSVKIAGRLSTTFTATARTPASAVITSASLATTQRVVRQAVPDTLRATVSLADGRPLANATVTWRATGGGSVSPLASRTDNAGVVRALWTLGDTAQVQRAVATLDATRVANFAITAVPGAVATLSLAGAGSVYAGQTMLLGVQAVDQYGNAVTGRPTAWSSSNSSVATVNGSGLVTAVAAGTATITATIDGVSATKTLTIVSATGLLPVVSNLSAADRPNGIAGGTYTWFSGTVDGRGLATSYWFEYGLTPTLADVHSLPPVSLASGASATNVSQNSFYSPGTALLYYRLVAQNSAGRTWSPIEVYPSELPEQPGVRPELLYTMEGTTQVFSWGAYVHVTSGTGPRPTSYTVKRSIDGGMWMTLGTGLGPFIDESFPLDGVHQVRYLASACAITGCSIDGLPSDPLATLPLPLATGVTATPTAPSTIHVAFSMTPVSTQYRVVVRSTKVSDPTITWTLSATGDTRSFDVTTPPGSGVAYQFVVRSVLSDGRLSAPSAPVTATTP